MARFLTWLLLLLGTSSAAAQACYCTYPAGDGRCYANTACWACVPGAYSITWQQQFCYGFQVQTCTASSVTEQRSCPVNQNGTETWKREQTCPSPYGSPVDSGWVKVSSTCTPAPPTCIPSSETRQDACLQNQSGSKTYTRQSTCPDPYGQPVWGAWQLTQDTCKWNPPTCIASTQTQSLSCPTGFVGTITQTQTSTCSDPYGQPVWGAWVTSSNTCVKSVTNPTNVLSPVSPISPVSPVMSAPAMTPAPVAAPAVPVPTTPAPTDSPEARTSTESAPQPQTGSGSSAVPSAASPAPSTTAGSGARTAALVQRLSLIGAMPRQQNIVEQIAIKQELPDGYRRQQDLLIELIQPNDSWLDRDLPADYRGGGVFGD